MKEFVLKSQCTARNKKNGKDYNVLDIIDTNEKLVKELKDGTNTIPR